MDSKNTQVERDDWTEKEILTWVKLQGVLILIWARIVYVMFCWKFDNYEKQQMTLFEKCNLANIPKKTNDVDI